MILQHSYFQSSWYCSVDTNGRGHLLRYSYREFLMEKSTESRSLSKVNSGAGLRVCGLSPLFSKDEGGGFFAKTETVADGAIVRMKL